MSKTKANLFAAAFIAISGIAFFLLVRTTNIFLLISAFIAIIFLANKLERLLTRLRPRHGDSRAKFIRHMSRKVPNEVAEVYCMAVDKNRGRW